MHAGVVDVDPVVGEDVLTVDHQRDADEVSIAEAVGGLAHVLRRGRVEPADELADGDARDEVGTRVCLRLSVGVGRNDRGHRAPDVVDARHGLPGENGMALRGGDLGHPLPHLAGTLTRVAELVDQRGHDLAPLAGLALRQQRAANDDPEVEALDPLRRPVGRQLFRADAPHLFRVGLEEDAVEAPAELVAHPLFERPRVLDREHASPEVARKAAHSLDRAQVPKGVHSLDRVSEEPAAVVDAREPAPVQQLGAEDLRPQLLDLVVLGEEAVAADVEPVAVVLDRAGQPSDLPGVALDHRDRDAALHQLVGGGQPGRARAHDHDVLVVAFG